MIISDLKKTFPCKELISLNFCLDNLEKIIKIKIKHQFPEDVAKDTERCQSIRQAETVIFDSISIKYLKAFKTFPGKILNPNF